MKDYKQIKSISTQQINEKQKANQPVKINQMNKFVLSTITFSHAL
jgi:hypothetical protein